MRRVWWTMIAAAPPILYAAGLAWLSHQPVLPTPPGNDKLIHVVAYLPLGALAMRWSTFFGRAVGVAIAVWTALAVAIYGGLDELHQSFIPGRDASLGDVAADALGGSLGVLAWIGVLAVARRIGARGTWLLRAPEAGEISGPSSGGSPPPGWSPGDPSRGRTRP